MKQSTIEVRSNKERLGECDVEVFENIPEAEAFFQSAAGDKAEADAGMQQVLAYVNAQHKANVTNTFRASKTRTQSPLNALRQKIGTDETLKAQLAALLAEHGLPSNLD